METPNKTEKTVVCPVCNGVKCPQCDFTGRADVEIPPSVSINGLMIVDFGDYPCKAADSLSQLRTEVMRFELSKPFL